MRRLLLAMIAVSSCAELHGSQTNTAVHPVQAAHQFSQNSIFHVRKRYVEPLPDGKFKITIGFGNAVLVGPNLLVTCAHIVATNPNRLSIIHVLGPHGPVLARVAVADLSRDVAILEAPVSGVPLKVRSLKDNEGPLYLVGVLLEQFGDSAWGGRFFHQVLRLKIPGNGEPENNEDPHKEYEPSIVVVGSFVGGMSGSALFTPDGSVVGILHAISTDEDDPTGHVIPARYLLQNLEYYYKHVAQGKK